MEQRERKRKIEREQQIDRGRKRESGRNSKAFCKDRGNRQANEQVGRNVGRAIGRRWRETENGCSACVLILERHLTSENQDRATITFANVGAIVRSSVSTTESQHHLRYNCATSPKEAPQKLS